MTSPRVPLSRASLSRRALGIGALALGVTLAGCSSNNPLESTPTVSASAGAEAIVVGSADFPESEVIANLYAGALRQAGFNVTVKAGIGSREVYVKALQDGSVDVIPEYNGNLLAYTDPTTTAKTTDEVMKALQEKVPSGLTVLRAAEAQDTDSLVVTAVTAEKYKLATIEDLARVCDKLVLGAPAEFAKRTGGLPGLKENYGCTPKEFKPISDGGGPLTVKALTSDEIQVADIFSTSPAIEDNGLVKLEDTKNNWAAQNIVPLVREDKATDSVKSALDSVQSKLTTQDLVDLNRKVSGASKTAPSKAAEEWLASKGIVK